MNHRIARRLAAGALALATSLSFPLAACPEALAQARGASAAVAYADTDSTQTKVIEVTSQTAEMSTGTYRVSENVEIVNDHYNGLIIKENSKVVLEIAEGATLTVKGGDAEGIDDGDSRTPDSHGGYAGIFLPKSSTLIIKGKGTLVAKGGAAGDGKPGGDAARGGSIIRDSYDVFEKKSSEESGVLTGSRP